MQFYLGSQELQLGKDELATNRQQFNDQFAIQKRQVNSSIYDQGKAKFERNSELNLSTDDYFAKNKI